MEASEEMKKGVVVVFKFCSDVVSILALKIGEIVSWGRLGSVSLARLGPS